MTPTVTHDPFTAEDATHENTRNRLAVNPALRQETIARHHLALCSHAQQMRALIDRRRFLPKGSVDFVAHDELIRDCEEDMVKAHWDAFGAKPGWQP